MPNLELKRGTVPGPALEEVKQLEQSAGQYSLNTGRVLAKVGWNDARSDIERLPVASVVVDNQYLTERGVRNLLRRTQRLILVTTNSRAPGA